MLYNTHVIKERLIRLAKEESHYLTTKEYEEHLCIKKSCYYSWSSCLFYLQIALQSLNMT